MRIYVFTEYFPNPYKPYFDEQFTALLRKGHSLNIFAEGKFDDVVNEQIRDYGLDSRTRYYPTTGSTVARYFRALAVAAFRRPLRNLRAAHRVWQPGRPLRSNVLNACRMLLLPADPPELCFIHDLAAARRFTFLRELYPGVPVALHFHGGEIPFQGVIDDPAFIFGRMDIVFTNTQYSKSLALARGCDERKILINPVGFELDRYLPREPRTYRADGRLRLLSVGRLSEEKGHLDALRAIRALRDEGVARLVYRIVGNGPSASEIAGFVRDNSLDGLVELVGALPKRRVLEELEAADVLLHTSVPTPTCEENQACALQEAMLMRAVVLTTRTGGVQESIPEEMRAFAVDCGDSGAIARTVKAFMAMSPEEMDALGRAGREFVRRRYDVERVTDFILDNAGKS